MPIQQRHLRVISRRFWGLFFGIIIAFAVIVQIGRQAFPLVNDYRHIISESLGRQLSVNVEIGEISAEWQGLRPKVILSDVKVLSTEDIEVFRIDTALAELSLVDTFIQGGLAWRTITFKDFHTTIEQKETNRWGLKGYDGGTANTDKPFLFDDPLDIFLFGRRVQIDSAIIRFELKDGKSTELTIPSINLENDRFFHRMTASVNIDDHESLRFVMEGYGDPRNKKRFSASGYLRLNQIPTVDILNALVEGDDKQHTDVNDDVSISSSEQHTDLEFWFKGSPSSGMTALGRLSIAGVPEYLEKKIDLPEKLSADISGAWKDGHGWFLNLQDINVDWGENEFPLQSLSVYGQDRDLGIRIGELDVSALVDIALEANKFNDSKIKNVISKLHPKGVLKHVDVSLKDKSEGYFLAKAVVENGSSEAFLGSPALGNIAGYVEASLNGGYIEADVEKGFKLDLVKVFDKPIILDDVTGQLAWRVDLDKRVAYLKSSKLSATQGRTDILGAFAMDLPFKREYGEQYLTLQIEADESEASRYKDFLPRHVPDSLTNWLGQAVQGGEAKNINVFYRGSVSKSPKLKPVYQVSADVSGVDLKYDKHWPALTDIKGHLFVDSGAVFGQVDYANASGSMVEHATVSIGRKRDGVDPDINVSSRVSGQTHMAQAFLLESPISKSVESFLPGLAIKGRFQSTIGLSIPLDFDEESITYEVKTTFIDNDIFASQIDLPMSKVNGVFRYSNTDLAQSKTMSAELWGKPFSVAVSSDLESGDIALDFSGEIQTSSLKEWIRRPELFALHDDFHIDGSFVVPTSGKSDLAEPVLRIQSDMSGVELDLPVPLAKHKEDKGEYELSVLLKRDTTVYQLNHNNVMRAGIDMKEGLEPAVSIDIGEPNDSELEKQSGKILVSGKLDMVDYDQWFEAYEKYIAASEHYSGEFEEEDGTEVTTTALLSVNQLTYGDFVFPDIDLRIDGDDYNWVFNGDSPLAKGRITIPLSDTPIGLNFDYLHLPVDEPLGDTSLELESAVEESAFKDMQFSDLVELDVRISELKIGDEDWGDWAFHLEPIENGVHLQDLVANVKSLRVGTDGSSQLYWTRNEGQNLSYFKGVVEADNVGDALEDWGQERLLDSKKANFEISAQWLAEPDLVSLANLNGDIRLNLHNGSFIRGAEAGENPLLRLIALFNFDTLARRVRLDFSDLAAKGFAYDHVYSKVSFTNGVATLAEPVIVESSSSRMQMAGTIDLVEEDVDAELVVTLPVGGNLAVATAFLAGVPAGLGVYIVSKVLDKTFDKVSSVSYRVKGEWEDPKIKVLRVFDDKAAKRKGDKLKEKKEELDNELSERELHADQPKVDDVKQSTEVTD